MTWPGSPQNSFPNDYEIGISPIIFFSRKSRADIAILPINMAGKSHNVPMNFMVNPLAFIWGWFIPHKDGDDLGMVYKKKGFPHDHLIHLSHPCIPHFQPQPSPKPAVDPNFSIFFMVKPSVLMVHPLACPTTVPFYELSSAPPGHLSFRRVNFTSSR